MPEKPENKNPTREIRYRSFDREAVRQDSGPLAIESALEVVVGGRSHGLLMQTPGREKELVTGYLFTEGLIDSAGQIAGLDFVRGPEFLGIAGQRALADLPHLSPEEDLPERPALSLSTGGLSGKEALDRLGRGLSRATSKQRFKWALLAELLQDLRKHQPLYEQTRGVHAVALYRADGTFLCCFEDVGRHNALDKVIGEALLEGWPFEDKLVVLSGRASLEMVLKSARAGLPLVLCFSSPTVLAVEAARSLNITLVGRQEERFLAAYTHDWRMI